MGKRIVCAGTFDRLHRGHINYLKAAKSMFSDAVLIVIVSRDSNSRRIKKKIPANSEKIRLSRIRNLEFVEKGVLGYGENRLISRVVSLKPDVVALGYDQWANENWLKKELISRGLDVEIIRMPQFNKKN